MPLPDEISRLFAEAMADPDKARLSSPLAPSAVTQVSPKTEADVVELVKMAEAAGLSLLPVGGGTHRYAGFPLSTEKPILLVSFDQMNAVTDFQPEDMTVTCEPGVTLDALQKAVAPRLRLGLDLPLADQATMGGAVSTNATGFMRAALGAPRDLLIGVRAVMTEGKAIKGGGKVVKNVAGYDLCKLFTGAWGTMGLITELTFKLTIVPETEQYVAWRAPDLAKAVEQALKLHALRLAPLSILATNELRGFEGEAYIVAGVMGVAERTQWQIAEFSRHLADSGLRGEPLPLSAEAIRTLLDRQARLDTPFGLRLSLTLEKLQEAVEQLHSLPLSITALCGSGTLTLAPKPDADPSEMFSQLKELLPASGSRSWLKSPKDADATLERWGPLREDFFLQQKMKESIDPLRTFSPGRFVGLL